jgi:predicted transcriptional regulator
LKYEKHRRYLQYEINRTLKTVITAMKITESELEILQVLWQKGEASVREVNDTLNDKREIGYTTTLKMMQLMYEKKMLSRDESQRTHTYKALLSETETQKSLTDKLLDNVFGGSALKLVMQALGNHHASKEELNEIKNLIQKIEKQNGNDNNA